MGWWKIYQTKVWKQLKDLRWYLSSQIPSNDKTGLGYVKEKKPEYSSVLNEGGN